MRTTLLTIGILSLIIGLLWISQGTGYINWPKSSFMISRVEWAYYGAALSLVGAVLLGFALRR